MTIEPRQDQTLSNPPLNQPLKKGMRIDDPRTGYKATVTSQGNGDLTQPSGQHTGTDVERRTAQKVAVAKILSHSANAALPVLRGLSGLSYVGQLNGVPNAEALNPLNLPPPISVMHRPGTQSAVQAGVRKMAAQAGRGTVLMSGPDKTSPTTIPPSSLLGRDLAVGLEQSLPGGYPLNREGGSKTKTIGAKSAAQGLAAGAPPRPDSGEGGITFAVDQAKMAEFQAGNNEIQEGLKSRGIVEVTPKPWTRSM